MITQAIFYGDLSPEPIEHGSRIAEKPQQYCSPDAGRFIHRGPNLYFDDGRVWDAATCFPCRLMHYDMPDEANDYSLWSDERRAEERAKSRKQQAEWRAEERARALACWRLALSARRKCTKDEFWTVVAMGRDR
jgi:hypothetical protein